MHSVNRNLRRLGAILLLTGPLAACSMFKGSDVQSIYAFTKKIVVPERVTLEEAASAPYASLGVRLDGSSEIMTVLATDTGGEQIWTSAAHIAITTSAGRVVRTSGLEHDLGSLVTHERRPGYDKPSTTHWLADYPDLKAFSVPVACEIQPQSDETIVILGKPIHTRRVVEDCRAEGRDFTWTYRNIYWADPDDQRIWRSLQHVNPKLGTLELTVLRPAAQQ